MPIIRAFQISHGAIAGERTPETLEDLYVSPSELASLYGCEGITEGDIRFAMALIHSHCNRPSLWPVEHETPTIQIAPERQQTRLPLTPVLQLTRVAGRFAMGRRDHQALTQVYHSYAAALSLLSAPAPFVEVNVNHCELEPATGALWIATSQFLLPFNQIKVRYIGGYVEIPDRAKAALALLINEVHAKGVSDRVRYAVGRVVRQYATPSFMSPQVQALLAPFVVQELA